ncbi:MAG: hypothetical protein JRG96_12740, partial [Deltaproteobacteria bacterium]|nr:hypothetical protein [Deltaproteobacteria bacterium]
MFYLQMAASCSVFAGFGYLLWRNLAIVDFSESGFKVSRGGSEECFSWSAVAKLHQIPLCTPPLYRMTFKGEQQPVYFCFFSFIVASVGFWSWDFRGFMPYARRHLQS